LSHIEEELMERPDEMRGLVQRVRAGEEGAATELCNWLDRYLLAEVTYRVGGRRGNDSEVDLDAICQDIRLAVLSGLKEDPGLIDHFEPWFERVIKDKCIDALRKAQRKPRSASLDRLSRGERDELSVGPGATWASVHVDMAVARLAPRQREAVLRRHFEHSTLNEVAAAMNLTLMQARYLLRTAEERLRNDLPRDLL
jgi:RNA polymerase sigma factor (sigma-70 family)